MSGVRLHKYTIIHTQKYLSPGIHSRIICSSYITGNGPLGHIYDDQTDRINIRKFKSSSPSRHIISLDVQSVNLNENE